MSNGRSIFCRVCVCLALAAFLTTSVFGQVVRDNFTNDYLQGKMDGEAAVNVSGTWFFAGFCLGLTGVLIAYMVKPSPSSAMLIGKSQAYINGYIEGYKDKAASEQGKKALTGMAVACAAAAAFYLILIVAIIGASEESGSSSWGK